MKFLLNVFIKVFVIQFYQSHISLFLFVLGMSAGFMRAQDHIALGALMVSSPILTIIPILVWMIYSIIVIKFNSDLLSLPENGFVYTLSFADRNQQLIILGTTAAIQLAPALGYGFFLIALASTQQHYVESIELVLILIALASTTTIQLYRRIRNFRDHYKQLRLTILLNKKFIKPFPFFFPEWIARRELFVLLGTKVCCLILLYATSQLYKFDDYDVRLIAMATILAFAAQSHLIWNLHYFENQIMTMTRNMPLSFLQRLKNLFITLCLLLLPETAFLAGRFPTQLTTYDLLSTLSVGWSLCIFFYGFLYWKSSALDQLTTKIFFFVIALIVATLFKVPLLWLSILLMGSGCWLWTANYYSFEPTGVAKPISAEAASELDFN